MMHRNVLSDKELRQMAREYAYRNAYEEVCPPLNRAQRRSAKGRMLVAQAEAAGLRAENEVLRQQLERDL